MTHLNESRINFLDLAVDDLSAAEISRRMVENLGRREFAIGLHITTLNAVWKRELKNRDFLFADYVYCDGWSIYYLSKLAGAKHAERIATTDLYPMILKQIPKGIRIVFIGGASSLGPGITLNWKLFRSQDEIYFFDGFPNSWSQLLEEVRGINPQLIFLGLGMPLELKIIMEHHEEFPQSLILTCGGMLRLLAGSEFRSPLVIQKMRLEWFYRICISPKRTLGRYAAGLTNFIKSGYLILYGRIR